MTDTFQYVDVKYKAVQDRGILAMVYEWPEKIKIHKDLYSSPYNRLATRDDNIIDFNVANGIARYYIIHGLEDQMWLYAKKFYNVTYTVAV